MSKLLQPVSSPLRAAFWTRPLTLAVALAVATFAVYFPTLNHGFVDYDDGNYVTGNSHVQAGLTWDGVKWAFKTGEASNWHPLTWLSHMTDVSLFGKNAHGHHFTSVLLHCLNAALVLLLLQYVTGRLWCSLIVAALFALHPLHVESVAWVSERKDVLSTCFGLLSLWAFGVYAEKSKVQSPQSKVFYGLSLLLFALGLMSKPMLVTLPFAMLLLDYWPLQRFTIGNTWSALWRLLAEKIPFLALAAMSCVVTFLVQKEGGAVSVALPVSARMANALVSYVRYLRKIFWPDDLSVLYPHPGHWPTSHVVAASTLLLLLTVVASLCWKRMPYVTVGWFWFVGTLMPVIGLIQVGIQSMADRYTYIPLIGVFVAMVWSADAILLRWPAGKPAVGVIAVFVLAMCSLLTRVQLRIWANSETLFRQAVAVTQDNYLAYNNLGFYLARMGRNAEAMNCYRASLKIRPDYADAQNNLGHALAEQGNYAEAIEHYRIALRFSPNNVEIHNNLGNALAETGHVDEAISHYEFALKRNPKHADVHNNFGVALAMKRRLDEAITHFTEAIRLKPDFASAHSNLGNAMAAQRKFTDAAMEYREALQLSPGDAQAHNNLGNVLVELGRLPEAVEHYERALQLHADNPEAHFNLGVALVRLGRREPAVIHFSQALKLRPGYAEAKDYLKRLEEATLKK